MTKVALPTNNRFDIPLLIADLQGDQLDSPVVKWGVRPRSKREYYEGATIHFYTDDYKFSALKKNVNNLARSGARSIVEPNFSCGDQTEIVFGLVNIYWKRKIARLCQEYAGMRVFVDLNVAQKFDEYNLLGVPAGWRAYATRGYTEYEGAIDRISEQLRLAQTHAGVDRVVFLVYGGGNAVTDWCIDHAQHGAVRIPEQADVIRGRK